MGVEWVADERRREVEDYTIRCLRAVGAWVEQLGPAHYEIRLPAAVQAKLEWGARVRLAFAPEVLTEDARAEYVTVGSPVLDQMLQLSAGRGQAVNLLFPQGLEPDFIALILHAQGTGAASTQGDGAAEAYRRMRAVLAQVSFPNARSRLLHRRFLHQPQLLFYFRVAFVSDEKREEIWPLLMDPVTEGVDSLPQGIRPVCITLPPQQAAVARSGHDDYTVARLYRQACIHLERSISQRLQDHRSRARERMARDLQRLEEYYHGLQQEAMEPLRKLFRRLAVAKVRADLARTFETGDRHGRQFDRLQQESDRLEAEVAAELDQLEQERTERVQELWARYDVRVEVTLTHAAVVRVPRVELTYRLTGPGAARRELTFLYDVLRAQVVDLECEACEGKGLHLHLCRDGDLVCGECLSLCPDCEREICPLCAERTCHVCDARICDECPGNCPLENQVPGVGQRYVCADCRVGVCTPCVAISVVNSF